MKNFRWRKTTHVHTTMLTLTLLITTTMITSAVVPGTLNAARPINVKDADANAMSLMSPIHMTSRLQGNIISEENLQLREPLPSGNRGIIWNNSLPDGVNRLSFGIWTGFNRELVDEFSITSPHILQGGSFRMVTISGAGGSSVTNVDVRVFPDNSGVPGTTHIYEVFSVSFAAVNTGNYYFFRPEIKVTVSGLNGILINSGTYWMQFQVTTNPADNCYWLTAAKIGSEVYLAYPDGGYNRWVPGSTVFGTEYGISYEITGIPMGVEHDVGITTIISPATGNIQQYVPKIKLINNGNHTETAVPVDIDINRYVPATTPTHLMNEAFSSWIPTGWAQYGNWTQSYTAYAGGSRPEARLYWGSAVDGAYLMSVSVDTTSVSTLTLSWVNFIDYYSSGTYFCVETRKNSGDTWTQRQPWTNPINANVGPAFYTIDITDDIGSATQVQFRFQGTPFNFDYWYVDNVQFSIPGASAYYTDDYYQSLTVDIPPGESDLTFSTWTPYGYHSAENIDIQFQVVTSAHMTGDEIPSDDSVNKTFVIYYPYLHDVGVDSIVSPFDDGPATTYPVKVMIKNYGQFPERWFNTDIQIGAEMQTNQYAADFEADYGDFTQTGSYNLWAWGHPTSGPHSAYSGTKLWATALGGNYVNYANERLDSPWITVPSTSGAKLVFWHWYRTQSYYDGGNVKWSVDGTNWYILGSFLDPYHEDAMSTDNYGCPRQPGFSGSSNGWKYIVMDISAITNPTFKIRFHFGSDATVSSYPGWYIDDVRIYTITVDSEYNDEDWQGQNYLNPGETREITYDAFTPEALAEGTSGTMAYIINTSTFLTGDAHPANDYKTEDVVLTYTHDVTIKKFNEPSYEEEGGYGDIIFSQRVYTPDENWYFYTSDVSADDLCQDDFWDLVDPTSGVRWVGLPLIYNDGWMQGNPEGMTFDIMFYMDSYGSPGSVVFTFSDLEPIYETGELYAGIYQTYIWGIDLPEQVCLERGWISIQSHDAPDGSWMLWGGSPEGNFNALQNGGGLGDNLAFTLIAGGAGCPTYPTAYVKKGSNNPIQVLVNNLGTFVETCALNVELIEYITDPYYGTSLYNDTVTGIVLDPLGDEQAVDFQSQLYTLEGEYHLFANIIPASIDDVPRNNLKILRVVSDGTPPMTSYTIRPPDGENSWYVSNVTIKLAANDPAVMGYSSGVAKIEYSIDGGTWQNYTGHGGFMITTNGQHTVRYKATDKVGNVEAEKTLPVIKIDRTIPIMDMFYQITDFTFIQGWELTFTVTANDMTSGMAYVEFYFNEFLQETVLGSGPEYTWVYNYTELPNVQIKAIAYDAAGNSIFKAINNPENLGLTQQSQQTHTLPKAIIQRIQTQNNQK